MLRNLGWLTLVLAMLLVPFAIAEPAQDEVAEVTIDPEGLWNANTVWYGYDDEWKYSHYDPSGNMFSMFGGWVSTTDAEGIGTAHLELARELSVMDTQAEGYRHLQEIDKQSTTSVTLSQSAIDSVLQEEQETPTNNKNNQDNQQEADSNQDTNDNQETPNQNNGATTQPQQNSNDCGINNDYLKFCYHENSINPSIPFRTEQATKRFVEQQVGAGNVEDGFTLVVYAPEDSDVQDTQEQRVRISREHTLKNTVQGTIQGISTGTGLRVVTGSYTSEAPGNQPAAAYLVADGATTSPVADIVTQLQQSARASPNEDPMTWRALSGEDLGQVWKGLWQTEVTSFAQNQQISELAQRIKQEKGIAVYVVASENKWQIQDQETLDKNINKRTKYGFSNAKDTGFAHPRPCAAYMLLDPEGIELYQPGYCALEIEREEIYREDDQEQAIQMLRSALRHTPRLDAQRLFVAAYGLAEQASTLSNQESEAEHLANWAVESGYFSGENPQTLNASRGVVLARKHLSQNNLDLAINQSIIHAPDAYQQLQPLAAKTAVQAASFLGDCERLADAIDRVQPYLQRGTNNYRQAMQQLDNCQYREIRTQCQPVSIGHGPVNIPQLEILYINDGLEENAFANLTQDVSERIIRTQNLNTHSRQIGFRRAPSTGTIATEQGYLNPPRINHRLMQQTASACYGEIIIVLSDDNYLPVTAGGNGFVSTSACNNDPRCIGLYATRSLAFGTFGMDAVRGSVTAPLEFDGEGTINQSFSQEQQATITEWFGGGQ